MAAFRPDEQRSYRILFGVFSGLFLLATAWAVGDEVWTRRPWKVHQQRWSELRPDAPNGEGVHQIVVPALDVIDRCPTCHMGVLDPQADGPDIPPVLRVHPHLDTLLRTHPPRRFGCTPCHDGQGVALTEGTAHGVTDPSWDRPLLRGSLVQSACLRCHTDEYELPGAPLLSRGRRRYRELGCGGCHDDGHTPHRQHAPSLRHVGDGLHPAGLLAAIATPDDDRATVQMPDFWPGSDTDPAMAARRDKEATAIAAYLIARAEPIPPAAAVTLTGASAERGKELFDTVGCRGCHRVGLPDMDTLEIRDIKPEAAGGDDAWGAFGGDDGFGGDDPADPEPADPESADPDTAPAPTATTATDRPIDFGPALGTITNHVRAPFLAAWIHDPVKLWPQATMPTSRIGRRAAADIAAWLVSIGPPAAATPAALRPPLDADLVARGQFLIGQYGCQGCHDIPGFGMDGRPGPALADYGRKDRRDLHFGAAPPPREQRTWKRYTDIKIKRPRAFATDEIAQYMPRYELDPVDAEALTIYLRGLRELTTPVQYQRRSDALRTEARALTVLRERNCGGCHRVLNTAGDIERYYLARHLAPPPLDPVGERLQPQWLFSFLLQPHTLRPWLKVRMPDFHLGQPDADALTRWFAARAGKQAPLRPLTRRQISPARARTAADLFAKMQCVRCHMLSATGDTTVADLAPDLALSRERLDPAWIARFLRDPGAILPGTAMPQFFPEGTTAYPEILGGDVKAQIQLLVDHLMNLGMQPTANDQY